MYFGIDVGGTKIQCAVYHDNNVEILQRFPTPKTYDDFLSSIQQVFKSYSGNSSSPVQGIGIGIPGTYTKDSILWVPNISYLENKNLLKDIENIFQSPAIIANDAQLALLGEVWMGAGMQKKDVILVSIGTGIGGAILSNGKLMRGRRGAAGAFGWLNLDFSESHNPNHGYFERHASGKALEQIADTLKPSRTSYQIVNEARNGDADCQAILNKFGHMYGVALASIASILDSELVIISGGMSEAIDLYDGALRESFNTFSAPGVNDVEIVSSKLGNLSGVYGAIRIGMLRDEVF